MAKWGEGDSRWIVQERDDGANVNGWHWTEKNCFAAVKARCAELLVGLEADVKAEEGWAKLTELKEVKGEATVNTRKGNKKFCVYELNMTLKWEGEWGVLDKKKVKGEFKISEFASMNDEDEYAFSVSVEGKGQAQEKLKARVAAMQPKVLEILKAFAEELQKLD